MTELNLTESVSWARYWGLKCVQQLVGCTDVEAQTCATLVKAGPIEPIGLRRVHITGKCREFEFAITCAMYRMEGDELPDLGACAKGWHISTIFVVDRKTRQSTRVFGQNEIPGYAEPKDLSD